MLAIAADWLNRMIEVWVQAIQSSSISFSRFLRNWIALADRFTGIVFPFRANNV